jgi:triosephosphate isomerase
VSGLSEGKFSEGVDIVVAPSFLYLDYAMKGLSHTRIQVSAQQCSTTPDGAYTGTISAATLRDFGVNWVILGHGECRARVEQCGGSSNTVVSLQLEKALEAGLSVILCIGEPLSVREGGNFFEHVLSQLRAVTAAIAGRWNQIVIAYEPLWAIGTGLTATPEQVQDMHSQIRAELQANKGEFCRVLYGGSVKPANAAALIAMQDVDGFLVGGASLKANDFAQICNAAAPH